MPLKIRQLAHALAVWRHGNFRRAAAEQNLSQPALSRSIQNLEESLGVLLFDRQTSEITPTAFGEALLQRAETILIEAAELEREMKLMKGLDVGRLSVAMGVYAAELSGNRAVAGLLKSHPGLQIRLQLRNWRDVERLVRDRQVDIGFGEIGHLMTAPGLRVEPVGRHEVLFFCRAGHPLLGRSAISEDDLDTYPFAGVPIPSRVAHLFPRNCRIDETSGDLIPPILVEDLTAMRTIVAGTDAFGLASPVQIEPWLRSGELAVVPFRASWLRLDYGFIFLASRSLSPAAEAFTTLVRGIERAVEEQNRILADEVLREVKPGAVPSA
ncbi:LysR family transcriptional regulator [Thioalkalivibrio sp.]|uniref:LysR family transcriptional regulator n=1 Tax=Thioalkalivibrio sp. TaxID=2093813 RepID=UPI0012D4DEB3|nr:LysR family transcriptional regulator [Thioalkalivibrio sp.]TVP82265.1 MAG: LysR family transcriptional regulator [Thioalkalivibrio sp.]